MKNPWKSLTTDGGNKIANVDLNFFDNNPTLREKFNFELFPQPFIGDKNADIYLLLANPGLPEGDDLTEEMEFFENISDILYDNLSLKGKNNYYLEKKEDSWWHGVYKNLKNEGLNTSEVSNKIFVIELCGYHSSNFILNVLNEGDRLPSINFSKYLVEEAIKEGKIILLPRARKNWFKLVPELENYDKCFFVAVNRGIELSKTTLEPKNYREVMKLLTK